MQQEKNKTKASPAVARYVSHFSARFPAHWEKPPKGLSNERDRQLPKAHPLRSSPCRKHHFIPKCNGAALPPEQPGCGSLLDYAPWASLVRL